MKLDRDGFEATLRRWFHADELTPAQVQRLWEHWQEVNADDGRLIGLERLLLPENGVGAGQAWWEEMERAFREEGANRTTDANVLAVTLSATPPRDLHPRVRLNTIPELVGTWRAIVRGRPRQPDEPVTEVREWRLSVDGDLATVGDAKRDGWIWCYHPMRPPNDSMLVIGARELTRREAWAIIRRAADELDLVPPGGAFGDFLRWHRVSPGP